MKFSPFIIFLLTLLQLTLAQNKEWINYTYNENIHSIVGKDNILWLATSGGLVKFNTISEEKESFNVSNSVLRSNHISPIALDSLGNVWMWKSLERAICFSNETTEFLVKFDGEEWSYYPLSIFKCQPFGLNPRLMEIDNNNNVWIGTGSSGLLKFNGVSWSLFDTTNSNIPTNRISDIAIDNENNKWMCSEELSGLFYFNSDVWEIFDSTNSPCPNLPILNVETDNNGKLWLSTYNKLISVTDTAWEIHQSITPKDSYIIPNSLKFDTNNEPWFLDNHLFQLSKNGWETYPLEPSQQYYFNSILFIDNKNNKWMNSKRITGLGDEDFFKGGLAKFDDSGWKIYSLSNSKMKGYKVRATFQDSKNNMWLGSDLIMKTDGYTWLYYSPIYRSSITEINEDFNGNMWFGTNGDGLLKFDGTKWKIFDTGNSTIPSNLVYDIDFDNKGNVWFTTDSELGLVKFDGNSFTIYDTTNSKIPSNYLHQVECDSKGNVWVGVADKGLVKFDQNTWTLYSDQIKWNDVSGLFIDDEDCIWISSEGLTTFKDEVWSYYEHDDSIDYYLNNITDIVKDKENNIWAIARYGLYKFDGNNWYKFDHTNSGLPDQFLGDIEFDKDGNLWIGTNSGVVIYKEGGVVTNVKKTKPKIIINESELAQNYPNPFNPTTTIKYSIPNVVSDFSLRNVTLKIYDILGREITFLVNKKQSPGNYEVTWEASNHPSGIYFYQLLAGNYTETKKMILLK